MTKAEEIYNLVEKKVKDEDKAQADAFREVAEEVDLKPNSVRGAFYTHKRTLEGGGTSTRTRTRETTLEGAVASARATLERAIASIEKEVTVAGERAAEAKAEHEALKKSAPERKQAIQAKLEALT